MADSRSRSPFLLPLVALSTTLVVLVIAIAVVISGRGAEPDPCVLGDWRVERHTEKAIVGQSTVELSGAGARWDLRADGTGLTDYGQGTAFTPDDGSTVELRLSGQVRFRFRTDKGRLVMSDVDSGASGRVFRGGAEVAGEAFRPIIDPARYTCDGGRLRLETVRYTTVMIR